jgi:hypothetical protein
MYIFLKRYLLLFLMIACFSASAQQVIFTVTGVKGLAKADNTTLKVGLKIKNNQTLQIEPNTYLSLATTDNRILEVTKQGIYSVKDLLARVPLRQELNASYVAFVVSELTKGSEEQIAAKNRFQHMNKTGAVKRAAGGTLASTKSKKAPYDFSFLLEYIDTENGHTLFGNMLELGWKVIQSGKAEEIASYEVEILGLDETSLFSQTVHGTEISIDLTYLDLAGKEGIICRVMPLDKDGAFWAGEKESYDMLVNLLSEEKKREISAMLAPSRTATEKLVEAKFFEDQKLFIDAIHAYKEAQRLAENNQLYEELYYRFWLRNSEK